MGVEGGWDLGRGWWGVRKCLGNWRGLGFRCMHGLEKEKASRCKVSMPLLVFINGRVYKISILFSDTEITCIAKKNEEE